MDIDWDKPFYVVIAGKEPAGPYTYAEISSMHQEDLLTIDDWVFQDGAETQLPIKNLLMDPDVILASSQHAISVEPDTPQVSAPETTEKATTEKPNADAPPSYQAMNIDPDEPFFVITNDTETNGPYTYQEIEDKHLNNEIPKDCKVFQKGWTCQRSLNYVLKKKIHFFTEAEKPVVNVDDSFYVIEDNNKSLGPYTYKEITKMYKSKKLLSGSWIYQDEWKRPLPMDYIINNAGNSTLKKLSKYYLYAAGLISTLSLLALGVHLIINNSPEIKDSKADNKSIPIAINIDDIIKKAEEGDTISQFELGDKYYNGTEVIKDYDKARKWFKLAALKGHQNAQKRLGLMYDHGEGVKKDYSEAVKWYLLSAEQGNPNAQYNLGVMYSKGNGVPHDNEIAAKWYKLAADQEFHAAYYYLGTIYFKLKDYPESFKWFEKAAEQNHADAQFNLGAMYQKGLGTPINIKEAIKYWKISSEQGNSTAQFNLGTMYYIGKDVPQDFGKSAKLFSRSSAQDNINAQYNLGILYMKGHGLSQNYVEAARQFRRAADSGLADAQLMLGKLYLNGLGMPQNEAAAKKWISKAVAQGHKEAQSALEKITSKEPPKDLKTLF